MVKDKVLVTGGAGFIGSHVVEKLVLEGYSVRVLDNLSTGNLQNIQSLVSSGSVEFQEGDIRDLTATSGSLADVSAVIHMAAAVSVPLSIINPNLTFDINLNGTLNLLRCSIQNKVHRFIFASSCAVCGNPKLLPVTEQTKTNPVSPYAESKLLGERYCLGFSQRGMLPTVILRFFNVYGPRQGVNEYSGVITRFIDATKKKTPIVIYGDGLQTRDFVNVADVASAIYASLTSTVESEIINVGSGKPTTIIELAKTIIELSGTETALRYENARQGDIKDSFAEISKARSLLGYEPKIPLKAGLQTLLKSIAGP